MSSQDLGLLLDLLQVQLGDLGVIAIKHPCELFQGRTLGLDVEKVYKGELEPDPALQIDLSVFFPKVVYQMVGVLARQQDVQCR